MSGLGRIQNWDLRGWGGDPGVGVPEPKSEPTVGLGAAGAETCVGGRGFRKAGMGGLTWDARDSPGGCVSIP